ncbi:pimeloyl-ACP methyl ester carboxylesterase [Pseudomonas duriflava]|uniref:Pimeloyl-ACP methyl ester carboxylesterase n=1 Tax=Pseudomonas duriflava TaxID=459528 RepID=A0A562Q6Y9_9PSED|nr:alpha/beta hydrolase [Pseudomonas duriflava]TWI52474.1 pimeloyl-ACP methyl ester carboxylesterase [Pseudomonas duriflava]
MNTSSFNFDKKGLILGSVAAACALALPRSHPLRLAMSAGAALGLGSALLKPSVNDTQNDTTDEAAPERVESADIGGIVMRWEAHGDTGPDSIPVILIHGVPTQPRLWRYVIPHIDRGGVRCLAWEQVGFGWSMDQGLERDISPARQADYLYDWLQHLGIAKAVFVGHDLGGGVIQQLLVKHPELSLGLVLVDSVAYDNWPVPSVRLARSQAARIEGLKPAWLKPLFLSGIYNLGHDNDARREESAALHWKPYDREMGPKLFAHQLRHLEVGDTVSLAGRLATIPGPKQVVWGEADSIPLASGQRLAEELNAPLTVIPGGRHFNPEDHPVLVAQAISEVVEQVRKQQGNPLIVEGAELG